MGEYTGAVSCLLLKIFKLVLLSKLKPNRIMEVMSS